MQLVYIKNNGQIIAQISDNHDFKFIFSGRPEDFVNSLDSIIVDNKLDNLKYYYIVNSLLLKYSEKEIREIEEYGKILTEDEREQLILPKPPTEIEVLKDEIKELQSVIDVLLEG